MALMTRTGSGVQIPQVFAVKCTSKGGYRVVDTRTGQFYGLGEVTKRNAEMNANACNLGFLRDRCCTTVRKDRFLCGGNIPAGVGSVCDRADQHAG